MNNKSDYQETLHQKQQIEVINKLEQQVALLHESIKRGRILVELA